MSQRTSLHGHWSSRLTFVLAVSGSAVGLGNLWKFPYITGQNGGGAFVLIYILFVLAIGLPIMMSEVLIGRRGRRNPVATMALLGEEEAGSPRWRLVGMLAVVTGFFILSFYSVVGGWSLAYIGHAARGAFSGADSVGISHIFDQLTGSWIKLIGWHTLFMLLAAGIVARGVRNGLERAVQVLMPALLLLLLILVFSVSGTEGFTLGLKFLFTPDFSGLTTTSVMVALGHAFFTLSLGMGAVMAYGAYLPQQTSILGTSIAVVFTDTLIALLACVVIFPIVFTFNLDPADGPGLAFRTLPLAFGQMQGGAWLGGFFFAVLTLAALTSAISLMEPSVAWLTENRGLKRVPATITLSGVVWLLGLLTIFSFNVLSDVTFWRGTLYTNLDHIAINILLPIGGLLTTIFAGWIMCRNSTAQELHIGTGVLYQAWRFLARYVAPVAVTVIFLNYSGVL